MTVIINAFFKIFHVMKKNKNNIKLKNVKMEASLGLQHITGQSTDVHGLSLRLPVNQMFLF